MKASSVLCLYDYSSETGSGHLNRCSNLCRLLTSAATTSSLPSYLLPINSPILDPLCLSKYSNSLLVIDSFLLTDDSILELACYFNTVLLIDDWIGRSVLRPNISILDWTPCAHLSPIKRPTVKSFFGIEYAPIELSANFSKDSSAVVYLGSNFNYDLAFLSELRNSLPSSISRVYIVGCSLSPALNIDALNSFVFIPSLPNAMMQDLLKKASFLVCTGGWVAFEGISHGCFLLLVLLNSTTYYDATGFIFLGLGKPFCVFSIYNTFAFQIYHDLDMEQTSYPIQRSKLNSQFSAMVDYLFQ